MIEKLLEKTLEIFKKPWMVIAAAVIITLAFIPGIFMLQIDNDIHNMLPKDNIVVKNYDRFEDIFGNKNLIFVAVESDNIYKEEVFNYVKNLQNAVLDINKTMPAENIAKKLRLTAGEGRELVNALNEQVIMGPDDVKALLTNKERLTGEAFLDAKFADKIVSACRGANFTNIYDAYHPPVKKVDSIITSDFIKGTGNKFSVMKLLDDGVINPKNIGEVKKRVDSWDMYKGLLVSRDNASTSLLIQLSSKDVDTRSAVYRELKKITTAGKPADIKVSIAGEPVISYFMTESILHDISFLMPLVLITVSLVLFLSFKNFQGVFYPMTGLAVCVVWTYGLMGYCGIPVNIVSSILPVVLTALGSAYGIHFMNNYFLIHGAGKLDSIKKNITTVGVGIFTGALTAMAGFLALLSTKFMPLRNFGLFTGIGIFFALVIVMYLLPSMLLEIKRPKVNFPDEEEQGGIILKFLKWFNHMVQYNYNMLLVISLIICVVSVAGISMLKVEMNNAEFFKKNAPVRMDDDRMNRIFDGTQEMDLVIESKDGSSVLRPEILAKVDSYKKDVMEKFPGVKRVMGINDYLKKMNQEMSGGKEEDYILPESARKADDYLMLYSGALDNFVTPKHDGASYDIVINRTNTMSLEKIQKYTEEYFRDFAGQNNIKISVSGTGAMYILANNLIVHGEIEDIIISFIAVFIIMMLDFRSTGLTIVALWPIFVALLMDFGFMGIVGIPLNAATAIVASLAIGTGIDYSIHFIVKYRQEMAAMGDKKDVGEAIYRTIMHRGRSIMYNVLAVMAGFFVLLFSNFVPLVQFGGLVGFTMLTTGAGAVIMIPATLKYLEKGGKTLL